MIADPAPLRIVVQAAVVDVTEETREQAIRRAAKVAKDWLEDWGVDLQATSDAYREAVIHGTFNGRRISPDIARASAKQFQERSDAVYDCGVHVEKEILDLL